MDIEKLFAAMCGLQGQQCRHEASGGLIASFTCGVGHIPVLGVDGQDGGQRLEGGALGGPPAWHTLHPHQPDEVAAKRDTHTAGVSHSQCNRGSGDRAGT